MRVAIIGQSQFAGEVYKLLQKDGHKIAGVFTIPDVNGRADPLGMYTHTFTHASMNTHAFTRTQCPGFPQHLENLDKMTVDFPVLEISWNF